MNGHPLKVERVPLGHVDDIDPHFGALQAVPQPEVEPLEVACRVSVRPQKYVIAVLLLALDDQVQVTALKVSVEGQESVLLISWKLIVNFFAFGAKAYI